MMLETVVRCSEYDHDGHKAVEVSDPDHIYSLACTACQVWLEGPDEAAYTIVWEDGRGYPQTRYRVVRMEEGV